MARIIFYASRTMVALSSIKQMICANCKGEGNVKLKFECEEANQKCKVCNSSGETKESLHYLQSWDDGAGNPSFYYGPPLDIQGDEAFKNYKIYSK